VTAPGETPSELEPLLKEALRWVIRLHSGEATQEDADAIKRWRQQTDENEQAFRDAVKLWRTFGATARAAAVAAIAAPKRPAMSRTMSVLTDRRAMLGGLIAASVATYFVIEPPLGLWPSLQELSADYRTSKGERRDVILSKDVSLKLNTQTSIAVRTVQGTAEIELISGETAINARRESGPPFVLKAASGKISAARADFDARCLDGTVSVSCLDGALLVEAGNRSLRLLKGEQVAYDAQGLGVPAALDAEQATAWQNGLLIVRDRALGDVVEEVNRYRTGKIIIMNSQLARRMITGTFHLDQLDDFVGQVRGLFGASVRSLPGGVVLMS
jgi:transmembrane sensor